MYIYNIYIYIYIYIFLLDINILYKSALLRITDSLTYDDLMITFLFTINRIPGGGEVN